MISGNNMSSTYLMLHVVLHVHVTASQNFETEGTQQVFCVFMGNSEMCLHIWEERGPEIADLWDAQNRNSASVKVFLLTFKKSTARYEVTDLAYIRHFPGLVVVLHVLQENLLWLKCQLTNLAVGWKKEITHECLTELSCQIELYRKCMSYLRIQSGCEHSRCGTEAGMESCTGGSNAGMLCGSPSSHCSAFPAPGGASYGSWTCGRGLKGSAEKMLSIPIKRLTNMGQWQEQTL